MPRLYRAQPDSSSFTRPRVLARVFAEPGRFESTVRFYERLTGTRLDMDLDMREAGIRIVAVGDFLVLELDDALLQRAAVARRTTVTMIFADLDAAVTTSVAAGAELVGDPAPVPTGRAARIRHPDGTLIEYLEHRPGPHDVAAPTL